MDKKRVINAAVTAGLSLSMIMTSVPATALAEGDQTDSSTAVEQLSTMEVGVNYWDVENKEQVCEGTIEVASDATSVNTGALVDVPEGYELVVTGDIQIMEGWIFVQIKPASTITVEVNYWDTVNNKQAGTGYVTVDADAYNVNSSLLTDIPYGYELVNTGDIQINDGYLYVQVKPAATKEVGINYYDRENGVQVYESTVTVAGDATSVNSSQLTDIPEGYELVVTGDYQINDRWIYVEVKRAATQTVGVNYYDVVNNEQVCESEITVSSDNNNVNSNQLTDIPEGYELVVTGDYAITDGWIFVSLRPITTQTVGINYYDVENNVQVTESEITVPYGENNVNSSQLTDIPEGYELVVTGDYAITDGWIFVSVRPADTPDTPVTDQTVGVNYFDVVNNEQVCESEITVAAGENNVNSSQLTDIPEGYELVVTGDFAITDGWIFVSLRPITTQTVGINYYDVENNVQVTESEITVPYGENNVNSSQLTDIPEGYELVVVGDYAITDGWIYVPVRPVATTQDVVISYVDQDSDEEVGKQEVTVDADDWKVNSSAMTEVPEGYELVEVGDFFIKDGKVTVYVKKTASEDPVETTYDVTFNYCLTNTENLVVTVNEGETVKAPTDPTCPGYTFTGWYVDVDRTQLYDFDSPVYEDMTLYAGWEEAADEGGETTTPDDTTPSDTTDETVTPVEPAATDETAESDELPKTGDTTNNAAVAGVGIAGLIAAAASVILRRRNQQ